ncbi:C-terminal processing peptidase [Xenococcus sp. PCC 7305]|uniref:carboxyl-terminal processing protease CtpC n=1 Tax=Xenococcus sp. PCC 7305 TaxID=102125 RepID=UPI0002AD054D|nr:carboxyl-terminal processing protease CtpC [Xenococcus sp. PCC 7305]ELS01411.1 C-terminal processing peptidase [Xenococcus sp. PCC 7305]
MVITKSRIFLGATALALSTVAVTAAGIHFSRSQAHIQNSPKELVDEVWQIINHQYVDTNFNNLNWQEVRQEYLERSYTDQEQVYDAVREMLEQLGDPYTRFMDPEEFQNMQIDTSGELTGVGIQIAKDEESDRLIVVSPIEDTPAFAAGILAQDIIQEIDGTDTKGMDVNEAVKLIRGKPGSSVILTIDRQGTAKDYEIVRARIQIHPVRARVSSTPIGDVGYIRLTQFSAQASKEMRDAIKDLEKEDITGYVLDLRSNPGGLLYSSIDIARMWLEEGTIVSTVDRVGEQERKSANNSSLTDKPLTILVDGGSASASEILSGALQDNDRAILIGTQTFGKGLVQSVRRLGNGSGLAVTIAKYLTPSGRDINKEGISPDFVVELEETERKKLQSDRDLIGTLDDPQFSKAIEILGQEVRAQKSLVK